jgi:hypothetical protein
MLPNTAPFDCTHHPAMSLPCGQVGGLPVGRLLDEPAIYRAAHAFAQGVDWRSLAACGHSGISSQKVRKRSGRAPVAAPAPVVQHPGVIHKGRLDLSEVELPRGRLSTRRFGP